MAAGDASAAGRRRPTLAALKAAFAVDRMALPVRELRPRELALGGHLEALQARVGEDPLLDDGTLFAFAAAHGHLHVLAFLRAVAPHAAPPLGPTVAGVVGATDHAEGFRWLLRAFPDLELSSDDVCRLMCEYEALGCLQVLVEERGPAAAFVELDPWEANRWTMPVLQWVLGVCADGDAGSPLVADTAVARTVLENARHGSMAMFRAAWDRMGAPARAALRARVAELGFLNAVRTHDLELLAFAHAELAGGRPFPLDDDAFVCSRLPLPETLEWARAHCDARDAGDNAAAAARDSAALEGAIFMLRYDHGDAAARARAEILVEWLVERGACLPASRLLHACGCGSLRAWRAARRAFLAWRRREGGDATDESEAFAAALEGQRVREVGDILGLLRAASEQGGPHGVREVLVDFPRVNAEALWVLNESCLYEDTALARDLLARVGSAERVCSILPHLEYVNESVYRLAWDAAEPALDRVDGDESTVDRIIGRGTAMSLMHLELVEALAARTGRRAGPAAYARLAADAARADDMAVLKVLHARGVPLHAGVLYHAMERGRNGITLQWLAPRVDLEAPTYDTIRDGSDAMARVVVGHDVAAVGRAAAAVSRDAYLWIRRHVPACAPSEDLQAALERAACAGNVALLQWALDSAEGPVDWLAVVVAGKRSSQVLLFVAGNPTLRPVLAEAVAREHTYVRYASVGPRAREALEAAVAEAAAATEAELAERDAPHAKRRRP